MKSARKAPGTTRMLFALSLSIALAMSGVGIIIPVVLFHIGRLGLGGASTGQVALQARASTLASSTRKQGRTGKLHAVQLFVGRAYSINVGVTISR